MTAKPSPPQAVQRIMLESLTLLEWAYCGLTATVTSFTTLYCNHQPAAAEPALLPVCYTGNPERASNSSGSQGGREGNTVQAGSPGIHPHNHFQSPYSPVAKAGPLLIVVNKALLAVSQACCLPCGLQLLAHHHYRSLVVTTGTRWLEG